MAAGAVEQRAVLERGHWRWGTLGSERAELRWRTEVPLWEFERDASSCLVQLRDLCVGGEKLQESPLRGLLEKMSLPLGRSPTLELGLDFSSPPSAHPLLPWPGALR